MEDLAQYRARIGTFAAVNFKKDNTKRFFRNVRIISKSKAKACTKTKTKTEGVHDGRRCVKLLLFAIVLCCYFLYFNQFVKTTTEFNRHTEIFHGSPSTRIEICQNDVYRYGEGHNISYFGDRLSNNTEALYYTDYSTYYFCLNSRSRVNYIHETFNYFYHTSSELNAGLPSDMHNEYFNSSQSVCNRPVTMQSLGIRPYRVTCGYLLGNKGMHSYNGNPETGLLNLTEEANNKHRLCVLLVDGGSQALRYTISRIVLDIKLKSVADESKSQLCENDKKLLCPTGSELPLLDGLTEDGLKLVWTSVLKQNPLASCLTQDMIFDYLASEGLDIQLKDNKQRVQELKDEENLLTQAQWDMLYPQSNLTADLESFDITLLCFIVRNVFQIKPTSGIWSQDPPAGDVGIGDEILRLRKQRNKLTDISSPRIDNDTFIEGWKELEEVLIRLKGQKFASRIQRLRYCPLGPNKTAELERSIEEWAKYDSILLESTGNASKREGEDATPLHDIMEATLKAWKLENVYITNSVTAAQEKTLTSNCVCVVGVPGAGKTIAIHQAALFLENKGFIIYVIQRPEELLKYFDAHQKQVFIFDDVLGVYSIKQNLVDLWKKHDIDIRKDLGTNTKLIVSMRTQLYNQASCGNNFIFLDKLTCINFCDETYCLGMFDMIGMLTHYLTIHSIDSIDSIIKTIWGYTEKELQSMTEEKRQNILSLNSVGSEFSHCFPLLCKVFCNEGFVRHCPREFFKNPFPALTKTFQNLKTNNKHQFCGLVLCAVFDGKLTEALFNYTCEHDNEVDHNSVKIRNIIMKCFDLEEREYLPHIKSALNHLNGVYVSVIGNTYTMSHTVFHDVVIYLFNDTQPLFMLKYGKKQFICDRIRIIKTNPSDDPYIIYINDDKNIERLADRLVRDLESDKVTGARFIANNPNIDHDVLFLLLKSKIFDKEIINKELVYVIFRECMRYVYYNRNTCVYGDVVPFKLIELCVLKGVDCNLKIGHLFQSPLHISVSTGSIQLTELLLQNGADVRRVDGNGYSALHILCRYTNYNKLELIKLLIEYGGDKSGIRYITNERHRILKKLGCDSNIPETPHEFKFDDDNLQLEEVFTDNSIKVLTTDIYSIKQVVENYTGNGKLQLVRCLHDNILTCLDGWGRNILHLSANDIEITRYLLDFTSLQDAINQRDRHKKTPYWYVFNKKRARLLGKIEDVDVDSKALMKLYEDHGGILNDVKYVYVDENDYDHDYDDQDYYDDNDMYDYDEQDQYDDYDEQDIFDDYDEQDNFDYNDMNDYDEQDNVNDYDVHDYDEQDNVNDYDAHDYDEQDIVDDYDVHDYDEQDNVNDYDVHDYDQQDNVNDYDVHDYDEQDNVNDYDVHDYDEQDNVNDYDAHDYDEQDMLSNNYDCNDDNDY